MKEASRAKTVRPRVRVTLRALGGRRLVIEGFGKKAPALVAVTSGTGPAAAWLSPRELRRLADAARRILR